jgi:membrane AbrB-like protein
MQLTSSIQRDMRRTAETLLIATLGGVAMAATGFPAGLVTGSMLAVACAALIGRPMTVTLPIARASFVLVGVMLGAVVTPEMVKGIANWPGSVAILVVSSLVMFLATACYLRFVHGWEPLSALLGASPGSMAQVMALSAEFNADIRGIAVVQVMRVLLIVIGLPAGLALAGSTVDPMPRSMEPTSLGELAVLLVVCAAVAALLQRLRFPGGLIFGALAASAVLRGPGLLSGKRPWWLGNAAVVTLGAVAGSRFANGSPRMLLGYLGAALGSFAVATIVAACFALIVVAFLPFRLADVAVAFAPGAQDTMMLLALALHLDPIYVGAHHLARFLVVSFTVAFAARRMGRRNANNERDAAPDT